MGKEWAGVIFDNRWKAQNFALLLFRNHRFRPLLLRDRWMQQLAPPEETQFHPFISWKPMVSMTTSTRSSAIALVALSAEQIADLVGYPFQLVKVILCLRQVKTDEQIHPTHRFFIWLVKLL